MSEIIIHDDENFERALKRFKKKCEKAGILSDLRKHYTTSAADTEALLKVGESKIDDKLPKAELAAWTTIANVVMNLDEFLMRR